MAGGAVATPPARPDDVLWSKTFDGNGSDSCPFSIVRTPDGGYVFAGVSRAAAAAGAYAGRADANGSLRWHNVYRAEGSWLNAAIHSIDGNFIFVGTSHYTDGYLLKADPDGNVLFQKSYRIPDGAYEFKDVVEEADGSLVILGITDNRTRADNVSGGGIYLHVLKSDADGNPLWSMGYGHGNLEAFDIVRSPDGGYAIAGYVFNKSGRDTRGYLLKIDETGNFLGEVCYPQTCDTAFYALCNADDGGYLLAGSNDTGNGSEIFLSRVTLNGTELWNRTFESTQVPYDIIQASDSGFVVASGPDILKVSEDGVAEWQRTLGGTVGFLDCVAEASDGSYVFGGSVASDSGNRSVWLVDIGYTKGPGNSPVCGCLPMLLLPALAVGLAAASRRR